VGKDEKKIAGGGQTTGNENREGGKFHVGGDPQLKKRNGGFGGSKTQKAVSDHGHGIRIRGRELVVGLKNRKLNNEGKKSGNGGKKFGRSYSKGCHAKMSRKGTKKVSTFTGSSK